jgi:steroid delta-isomerase-like uncharacterized protein
MPATNQADQTVAESFFLRQDELKGPLPTELLSSGYRAEIAGFPPMDAVGHAAFAQAFYAGFPDIRHTIDESQPTPGGAIVRFTLRGTHTGAFLGIPATQRTIEVTAMALMTLVDGKITNVRGIFDQLGLMRQLGVIPS